MADAPREFPDAPRVGVGAVILDGTRVLLARRGRAPSAGKWSIPGGLVDVGERLEDTLLREIEEESGLRVRLLGLCGVIDRVVREQDAVRYHYVIIDYAAEPVAGSSWTSSTGTTPPKGSRTWSTEPAPSSQPKALNQEARFDEALARDP